jgi:hypothetical protein
MTPYAFEDEDSLPAIASREGGTTSSGRLEVRQRRVQTGN